MGMLWVLGMSRQNAELFKEASRSLGAVGTSTWNHRYDHFLAEGTEVGDIICLCHKTDLGGILTGIHASWTPYPAALLSPHTHMGRSTAHCDGKMKMKPVISKHRNLDLQMRCCAYPAQGRGSSR